jgi:succinate dehydrogenase / fumarate reductase cytochrome b subunit
MAHSKPPLHRPLSPHLQIYRPALTMIMSIVHRITGAALYFGTVILAVWLMTAATSASGFAAVHGFLGSWLGQLVLIGYSWALLHHMFGGIRHFVWDTGRGFGAHERHLFAVLTLVGSVLSTGLIWVVVYSVR